MGLLAGDNLGEINPPANVDIPVANDPQAVVVGIIRGGLQMLLVASFIIAFIWTILAGLRFIFASGDEKAVAGAWAQIYWGLIGLAVVAGSFAIIRLVEIFFNLHLISGGFVLPHR